MPRASFAVLLFASLLPAQTLTGKLTDPLGDPVPAVFVRLTNTATGAQTQVTSSKTGEYSITVPPGAYDLLIPSLGFQYKRTERKGLTLEAGKTQRLDLLIECGGNLCTPGDEFSISARANHPAPSGPTPRTRDGHPDFSGVWAGINTITGDPQLLPWAAALVQERAANGAYLHPSGLCLPADIILNSAFIYRIVQTSDLIVLLWDGNLPGHDQIFLDGRAHPANWFPNWMGHSVGHWEGETLVVDTVGFNDKSWLGIAPHTEQLHIVQRYSRPDLGHMYKDVTIEDPGAFTAPWKFRVNWELAPGEEVYELVCDTNAYLDHLPKQ
jgi:hypothetical protein